MLGMRRGENKGRRPRLAFLGTLASGLAHEIKNPLSAMLVNLQLLREDLGNAESAREQRLLKRVGVLEREISRLEQIVDGFLRFARGYQLTPVKQSMNKLLREVVEFWAAKAAAANVEVQLTLDPELPDVSIDATFLKQALLNLLNNAFDALTDPSGAGAAGTAGAVAPEDPAGMRRGQIVVASRRQKNTVEVLVIDNGPGIPADVRERVFDPYFSTKAGGSGLGLPTAKRIVEELGGTLTFDTETGRGTSFKIALREAPPEPAAQSVS